jgi:hypothetical protein
MLGSVKKLHSKLWAAARKIAADRRKALMVITGKSEDKTVQLVYIQMFCDIVAAFGFTSTLLSITCAARASRRRNRV